ncbi:MAG: menaquinone biosynthesis decarboxylase [Candidatus Eremiobacteraeota bacterium]|nr:menaquinone biosynthesis decarboxylase [Candidatus Eremiobacteraeota bacterium]MBC5828534.1 menaquinone biosynthesis decarboxylase [Candidatus Eremiobacteraeota bacterium]
MHDNVREFIDALRKDRDLVDVRVPVDRRLEITAIADRCVKSPSGGPALLFHQVKDSAYPLLINAFGSERRMCRALGVRRLDDLGDKVRGLLRLTGAAPAAAKVGSLWGLKDLVGILPKTVAQAPCQDVVAEGDDVNLGELPVLTCWPQDGGPFITLPLVFTKSSGGGAQNVGMYRMQVYDARTTGMHWQRHKHGREHQASLPGGRDRMPVAVAIGADPVVTYAATAPLPGGVDEMMLAGFLRGRRVPMVRCRTVDLKVPAESEFVLEGYVDNSELRREGPFGDHTGVYTPAEDYPVFHVTCMTRRRDPVYVTTIVGRPPMEDQWLGKATERLFLPLLQQIVPEVVDYNLPVEGVFQNLALVAIRKRYPGHAKKVMYALWGLGHMLMLTRNIIVVDERVDVQRPGEVAWVTLNNVDAGRDLVLAPGPVDALDHAAPFPCLGTKLGIDATRKGVDEGYTREWPSEIAMAASIEELVTQRWRDYGLPPLIRRR